MEIPVNLNQVSSSEVDYRQLLQWMPGAVYICDREGRITYYNEASAQLWGREPELWKDRWCGFSNIYEADGVTPMPLAKCQMRRKLYGGKVKPGNEIIVGRPDREIVRESSREKR